ncbi:hypothetical protein Godav_026016 [Gossypium davidsonii]|uniref:Uncharacterized protein n=2 Tax=Gossypium TaxID=3633 RepID=A0A7J8TAM2_GOSDV|nr:hypothetical protein [Gossypium davidsonii]MBA0671909.1 hypothetical protein [Gossypium klotzschianum]
MNAGERVRVDSLDMRSSFWHGSTITFEKLIRFLIESSPKIIHL